MVPGGGADDETCGDGFDAGEWRLVACGSRNVDCNVRPASMCRWLHITVTEPT